MGNHQETDRLYGKKQPANHIIIAIAGTVLQVFSPKMLGNATTVIFDGIRQGTGINFSQLGTILLIVAAMYVGICIATFLQQRIMVIVAQKTTYALRNELRAKMNKVPVSYFDKNANGNLMSVAINDVDNIVTNLQQSLTDLISSVILFVGILWIMISISPLINLLQRFYEIQAGSIRIDGTDIRNVDRQTVRQRIGMVLQDTWLFTGTIYDNIKYGNENASKEQIYAAARAAYADDFIQKLPNGYNTILNEEASNISQGQRQLITIARAFVSNPEILILDEATSNVDSRTELIIQSAMKRLLKGRTSFVVAHRLSTIYDADRILVMDNGDIVETGTHKELLEKNGVYADIYHSQFAQKIA